MLTDSQRQTIFEILLSRYENGKLEKGCISEVAAISLPTWKQLGEFGT